MGAVVVRGTKDGLKQDIAAGRHLLVSDEPTDAGGADAGPDPYALVLAGLGACTSMTLRMYAAREKLPLEAVTVRLSHRRVHAKDCADCATEEGMVDQIEREVELEGPLTEEQKLRLVEIADRCPVHRTLVNEIKIVTALRG